MDPWSNTYNICGKYIADYRTAVDIGCRSGDFAQHLCPEFETVVGYDFRAKPAHVRKLFERTGPNFTFHHVGLGEDNYITKSNEKAGRIKGEGDVDVQIRSLDSYNLRDVDFIKIDVEGYEPKVLMGAEKTIKKYWPVLCIEINTEDNNSQEIVESWGYVLKEVDDIQEHDFIFVKEK